MIHAIIRISPFPPNAGTPPFFGKDKFTLVKACVLSFLNAGSCRRTYLLDNCPKEYVDWFTKHGQGEIFQGVWGKKGSLYTAYDVGRKQVRDATENILFLEDDYLWRPNTLPTLDTAITHFGLATPYDHAGHYVAGDCMQIYPLGNTSWRWCRTTTHTFGVNSKVFVDNIDDFYYGMHDWQMWTKLDIDGHRVYSPLYSMATHLVDGLLAYNTNWEDIANWYKERVKDLEKPIEMKLKK